MKHPSSFLFAAASLLLASFNVTTAQEETIWDFVVASPDHTMLAAAVNAAAPDFVDYLFNNPDVSITLFAPDNDAISTVDPDYMQLLYTPPWVNHLSCVLLGHVYGGGALFLSNITGPMTVSSAMPGYLLNLDGPDPAVTVNEIAVSIADIAASNGVVHSLSTGVLLPPCAAQDLDDTLASGELSTLSVLVGLIQSPGLESLRDALKQAATAAGMTVLAPTDAAFAKLDPLLLEQIASDPALLTQVISYHIIPANYNESWSGTFETMLAGETVNLTQLEGADPESEDDDILMINDATATNSTFASNGIIVEIDSVLIPSTLQTDDPDLNMTLLPDQNMTLPPAESPPPNTVPPLFPTAVPPLFPTAMPPAPTTIDNPPPTIPNPDLNMTLPPAETPPTIVPGIPEEEEQEEQEEQEDPSTPDVPPPSSPGKGAPAVAKGKGYYYHSHGYGGHYHRAPQGGGIFQPKMMKPRNYGYKQRHYYYHYSGGSGGSGSMMKSGSSMMHSSYSGMSGYYGGKGMGGGGGRGYYVRVRSRGGGGGGGWH